MFQLLEEEGLCLGPSSGVNVAGAMRLAHDMGPGHRIVTVLAIPGRAIKAKPLIRMYLKSQNLPLPRWLVR